MNLHLIGQDVINAVTLGSLFALFALGIALLFGIMGLLNFAHGQLIMIGAYVLVLAKGADVALLVVFVLAACVLAAVVMDRVGFAPLHGASSTTLMIAAFAISYLLENLAILVFGATPRSTNFGSALSDGILVGSLRVPVLDVVIVGITVVVLLSLDIGLRKTALGVQMRAAAEDIQMARALGVRANRVIAVAFGISGLMAGVAAVFLVAQAGIVSPAIGDSPIIAAFIVVVLGGMGSLRGVMLGAYVFGAITVMFQATLPSNLQLFRDAFAYAAIIVLLLVRPQGLLGKRLGRAI